MELLSIENEIEIPQKISFAEVHKNSIINLKEKYERPPLAISIGTDSVNYNGHFYPLRFGTYGNISLIKGEEKSRKTFLKSMILACAIGGNANLYNSQIAGHELKDKFIIDIDTEQDKYDNWMSALRIPKMIGQPDKPNFYENYIPVNLRQNNAYEIRGYLEWLFLESEYRNNLGIVSIDGFVDCVDDFNNLLECKEFTQKLMKYSSISKSHITGVLHVNPGMEKARGHFGTMLQQKAEMVVIVKDCGDYSEVTCQRVRGGKKFESFTISVDQNRLPYKSEFTVQENWKN